MGDLEMGNSIALLENEEIVKTLGNKDNTLTLTTKRVRDDFVVWGRTAINSITLDSIASCGAITKSYPFLLILGILSLLASAFVVYNGDLYYNSTRQQVASLIVVGIILIVLYFFTRKSTISISSNGGRVIDFPTKGINRKDIELFINTLENEKLK